MLLKRPVPNYFHFQKKFNCRIYRTSWKICLIFFLLNYFVFSSYTLFVRQTLAAPANWIQVNIDGFGNPPTSEGTKLFIFDDQLYAYSEDGLFQLRDPLCRSWKKVTTPISPSKDLKFIPLDNYLYLSDNDDELWWIEKGESLIIKNWRQVTSQGLPGGSTPTPFTIFKGQLYAVYSYFDTIAGESPFEIWRSKDIARDVMNWEKVVSKSFSDPTRNRDVQFMTVFNDKIYAGTMDRRGSFGIETQFGMGVKVWESPSGDMGTWSQVNVDGFGTEVTQVQSGKRIRTNQDIGSWAVYQSANDIQQYLYIGTKAHLGAEVWRYDGAGKGGWKNVTPPWGGIPSFGRPDSIRFSSMVIFQNVLYVAESYSGGHLAKFDGKNWMKEVNGPNPFDPQNGGIESVVVLTDKLYVSTSHLPYSAATKGDQVWGYPYKQKFECADLTWLEERMLTIDKNKIKAVFTLKNVGEESSQEEYLISVYLDDEPIYNKVLPLLAANAEVKINFSHDISSGEHNIKIISDATDRIAEKNEDNNIYSINFIVPTEEVPFMLTQHFLIIIGFLLLLIIAILVWRFTTVKQKSSG